MNQAHWREPGADVGVTVTAVTERSRSRSSNAGIKSHLLLPHGSRAEGRCSEEESNEDLALQSTKLSDLTFGAESLIMAGCASNSISAETIITLCTTFLCLQTMGSLTCPMGSHSVWGSAARSPLSAWNAVRTSQNSRDECGSVCSPFEIRK